MKKKELCAVACLFWLAGCSDPASDEIEIVKNLFPVQFSVQLQKEVLPNRQKPQKQRINHPHPRKAQIPAAFKKTERHRRNQGKQPHTQNILFQVSGVKKSFRQKIAHNWRRQPANHMKRLPLYRIQRDKCPGNMIDQHCDNRNDFQLVGIQRKRLFRFLFHRFLLFSYML